MVAKTCGAEVKLTAPAHAEPLAEDAVAPALAAMLERVEAWAKSDAGDYVMGLHDSRTLVMLGHELSSKERALERELEAHPELRGYLVMACLASHAPALDCTQATPKQIVAALRSSDDATSRRAEQRALFAKGCRLEDVGRAYQPRFDPPDLVVRAVQRCGATTTRRFLPTVNRYHVSRVRCGDEDAVLVSSEVNTWWEPVDGERLPVERQSTRVRPVMVRPLTRERFDAAVAKLESVSP